MSNDDFELTDMESSIMSEEYKEDNTSELDMSYAQSLLGFTKKSEDFKSKSKTKTKSKSNDYQMNNNFNTGIPVHQLDPYGIVSKNVALIGLTHQQEHLNGYTGKVEGFHNLAKTYIIKLDQNKHTKKNSTSNNNNNIIPSNVHVPYENILLLFNVDNNISENGGAYDNDPNFEDSDASNHDEQLRKQVYTSFLLLPPWSFNFSPLFFYKISYFFFFFINVSSSSYYYYIFLFSEENKIE